MKLKPANHLDRRIYLSLYPSICVDGYQPTHFENNLPLNLPNFLSTNYSNYQPTHVRINLPNNLSKYLHIHSPSSLLTYFVSNNTISSSILLLVVWTCDVFLPSVSDPVSKTTFSFLTVILPGHKEKNGAYFNQSWRAAAVCLTSNPSIITSLPLAQ